MSEGELHADALPNPKLNPRSCAKKRKGNFSQQPQEQQIKSPQSTFFSFFPFLLLFNFLIFNNFSIIITLFYFIIFFLSFFLPFLLSCVADRVLVLRPGVRPVPLRWESGVQDIGPPEISWLHLK